MTATPQKKKLIEVALPLEAINVASAKEKSIRHGHPSTLHLWWARRPLAACRAVLFASIVNDPSSEPERFPTEELQEAERQRLFRIIEELVKWENTTNETVLNAARAEIMRATDGNPPPVLDPFCGGGSIPLEAQRLGLEAHGSDLNPVAVLITKALIEIPPKFANQPPAHPVELGQGSFAKREWRGAQGLAEDVRYYGKWMRDEAECRIGHLYPKAPLPDGSEATVIAWLWTRTVKCPNPACGAQMPLMRSFELSTKKGSEAWVEPVIDRYQKPPLIGFTIKSGKGKAPESPKIGRGAKFRCLVCSQATEDQYIKNEGQAMRLGAQLMAVVAEIGGVRSYLTPSPGHEAVAHSAKAEWVPTQLLANDPRNIWCINYGLDSFEKLFTPRQLVALSTFSSLVSEARDRVLNDALYSGAANDEMSLEEGGTTARAYADAVATYLSFAVDKMTDTNTCLCTWQTDPPRLRATFGRQALPMTWDYAEANIFGDAAGDYQRCYGSLCEVLDRLDFGRPGIAYQADATATTIKPRSAIVSTDPPYYDNISYADLSDFFYVWLRHSLGNVMPDLFSTLLVPKVQELIATPQRFDGSKKKAEVFFEEGLGKAFAKIREAQHQDYPSAVYYAFKQTESEGNGSGGVAIASTGWETMLEAMLRADFSITGTWPMRSELTTRNVGRGTNALASSIILVCRPRVAGARPATRQEFLRELKRELPIALKMLQHGNVAPVDLAQASIGPGMAIFSRHSRVVESDGKPMRVRTALQLINQTLDEVLTEQEGEYDSDTRWALAWFDQHAHDEGLFGQADVLARAKNSAVSGLVEAGIVASRGGKVRLLRRDELPTDWNPLTDTRLTVWETAQQLIRALDTGGEVAAATLLRQIGPAGETARDLAYRLYTSCERKGWAAEARAYNSLVVAWPQITQRSGEPSDNEQMRLLPR